MLYFKAFLFALAAPGTVTGVVPWLLLRWGIGRFEAGALRWVGLAPFAIGLPALLWCFLDFIRVGQGTPAPFDAPRNLVVRGLYRRVRNPMYVAVLSMLAGEALFFQSWAIAAWGGFMAAVFHLFVVLYEEPRLRKTFGAPYEDYLRSVPRWIPRRLTSTTATRSGGA